MSICLNKEPFYVRWEGGEGGGRGGGRRGEGEGEHYFLTHPLFGRCSELPKATGIVVNGRVRGAVQVLAWLPWQVATEIRNITIATATAKIIGFCGDTRYILIYWKARALQSTYLSQFLMDIILLAKAVGVNYLFEQLML